MTTEQHKRDIFEQPCAFKLVFSPEGRINSHVLIHGPDCWHMFYESDIISVGSTIHHATSEDLLIWTSHEPILQAGGPGMWDHVELNPHSIIEHESKWYLFLQGKPSLQASRRIGLAVSEDLWHWRKFPDEQTYIFTPSPSWSGWTEDAGEVPRYQKCKDASVIYHQNRFIMYYACSLAKHGNSCIAVASSDNLIDWEDEGPIITAPWIDDPLVGPAGFEEPRIVRRNGKFYVFVMYFWGLQYAISDDPYHFGPFRVMGPWHASNIFQEDKRWYISHVMQNAGKSGIRGTNDRRKPLRGLYLAGLVWTRDYPFVTDLRDVIEGWPK